MSDALLLCGGITINTEGAEKQIDSTFAAYKLLEILFEEKLINFDTYERIEEERKTVLKSKNALKKSRGK